MRKVLLCVMVACLMPLRAGATDGPNVFGMFGDLYHPLKAGGTVALFTVTQWEQLSKPEDVIHRGRVTLRVARMLYGEKREQFVLPATYATHMVKSDYGETWPKLSDYPKEKLLLCAILPGGVDPVAGDVGTADGGATVIVEVKENDATVKSYERAIALHLALQKSKTAEERFKLVSPAVLDQDDVVRRYGVAVATEELWIQDVPRTTEVLFNEVNHARDAGRSGSREDFDAYIGLVRMATAADAKESDRNVILKGLVAVFLASNANESGYSLAIQEVGNIVRQGRVPAAAALLSSEQTARLKPAIAEARLNKNDASVRNAAEVLDAWLNPPAK